MSNNIKQRLKSGEAVVGSWLQLPHPSVAEIMAAGGFDWVAVDLEHGAVTVDALPDLFRAFELRGTVPFARVAEGTTKDIKQVLDAGGRGVIVPMVETAEQIADAIASAKYPPEGKRGVGYCRGNLFGKEFERYARSINAETVVVAQIEHIRAIRNLDAIVAVPGLDAVMIGPYDLSASMGLTGDFEHPQFQQALRDFETIARRHKMPIGMHVVQPDRIQLQNKIAAGYQFIAYGIDAVFLYNSAINPRENK